MPISALEHYAYCPRQCALIHVEQTFDENLYTLRGSRAHERVASGEVSWEAGVQVRRSLPLYSENLGIHGVADVVEMTVDGPIPVEYKVGRVARRPAMIQLCAQVMCLEEMFGRRVPRSYLYLAGARRRMEVMVNPPLRQETLEVIESARLLIEQATSPPAPNDRRCPHCSLFETCLPGVVSGQKRIQGIQSALFRPLAVGSSDA